MSTYTPGRSTEGDDGLDLETHEAADVEKGSVCTAATSALPTAGHLPPKLSRQLAHRGEHLAISWREENHTTPQTTQLTVSCQLEYKAQSAYLLYVVLR